jgi:hypothetical protein
MTVEAAVVAGIILVCYVIWQTHRINGSRLTEIEHELSGLREIVSRLLLMAINESGDKFAAPATAPEVPRAPAGKDTSSVPPCEIEPDLLRVDGLCAKLITLAPPKEALPLTSRPGPDVSKGAAH